MALESYDNNLCISFWQPQLRKCADPVPEDTEYDVVRKKDKKNV